MSVEKIRTEAKRWLKTPEGNLDGPVKTQAAILRSAEAAGDWSG
jgi:hypothetical protein